MLYKFKIFSEIKNIEFAIDVKSSPSVDMLQSYFTCVDENYLPARIVRLNQVHSDKIYNIENLEQIAQINGLDGDGLITTVPDIALSISVADCAPVALFDIDGSAICLIHSGWRGTEKKIVPKSVKIFLDIGISRENIFAYIGPTIGVDDYEVGEEFLEKFPSNAFAGDGKIFFDLAGEIERQLKNMGISKIAKFPLSTYSENWLHSYRRDGDSAGRNILYLWKTN
ncbi:peptidoglycan editing factor PgeF [bacterium]|nr:peptidoglycan editing factor PgeF [bacterium]